MVFALSQQETEKIVDHFGQAFYENMIRKLERYSAQWQLHIERFIAYYSVNCLFICRSERFGPAVLKIGNPSDEVLTEVNLLKEYHGGRFCRLFDWDIDNGVILEEYIHPGFRLREEPSLEKRLSVFSDVFKGLHIPSCQSALYPTYQDWVNRITAYMSKREDEPELSKLMMKAKDICASLCRAYPRKLLLHGDLHHDNLVLGENQQYRIIDPKGVIGDPIFDIPRFILNEFYGVDEISYDTYRRHVETISSYLQTSIGVPIDVIYKCVFVETAMANCWKVEINRKPNLNYVRYSEAMLH